MLSCILPHNCYRLVSASCCKPLLSDIIIIIIIIIILSYRIVAECFWLNS